MSSQNHDRSWLRKLGRLGAMGLATLGGGVAIWQTWRDLDWLESEKISVFKQDLHCVSAILGRGVFGVCLIIVIGGLLAKRRLARVAYWAVMIVGSGVLLLDRFGWVTIVSPPDDAPRLAITAPGFDYDLLGLFLEISILGALIVIGTWIADAQIDPGLEGNESAGDLARREGRRIGFVQPRPT